MMLEIFMTRTANASSHECREIPFFMRLIPRPGKFGLDTC